MSVLIRGMEIPERCGQCFLRVGNCKQRMYIEHRPKGCPLVEVKEPHGRMIDVNKPMTKISTMMQEPDYQHEGENWMVGLIMARDAIDEAPTVIEAEDEEY